MKSILVKEVGGPEKMELVEVPTPSPGPRQALVRIAASGVNFIDVYFRIGLYKADVPIALGNEAAGRVEAVGAEVTEVGVGDRVAWAMARGSYAEYAAVPAAQLVKIPDHVDFQMAKMLGARVFGTVSTPEKAAIARQSGADETILYTQQDFEAEVKRLTGG